MCEVFTSILASGQGEILGFLHHLVEALPEILHLHEDLTSIFEARLTNAPTMGIIAAIFIA
ncbi:MAG: hypothetical protein ACR2HX_06700 [Pyrinomonadaceae bacterium]